MSLHNFLLFHLRSHIKNSCFVFHRGFQTPQNNKSTRPQAEWFHYFLGVWNPWWNTRTCFLYITSKICHSHQELTEWQRSLHASLKLFTNLIYLKTRENVGFVSSYLSTSNINSTEKVPGFADFLALLVWKLCTSQIEASISSREYPGHLTIFLAREGGHFITTRMGWGIWSPASISC